MKSFELFQEISPETASSIFQYLRDEEREVYSATLATLASNRKLRPVFIQRKPAPAQIDWLAKNIKLRGSAEMAEHVLQIWLMKAHQDLLVTFLDGVGIAHDGEGAAEELPDSLDAKKLKSTVTKLLKDKDPELVRVYLHVFQMQKPEGWPELTSLIETTPELQFGAEEPEESPEVEEVTEEPAADVEPATEDSETEKS